MSSENAAEWLIETYDFSRRDTGDAYIIMPHRSWAKADQLKLANYFLSNLPHTSDRGYRAFLSYMSLPMFIRVMKLHLPEDIERRKLIKYYLVPLLNAHPQAQANQKLVDEFIECLSG